MLLCPASSSKLALTVVIIVTEELDHFDVTIPPLVTFTALLTSKMLLRWRRGRLWRSLPTSRGLVTRSAAEMERLGASVARGRAAGDVIFLRG